MCLDAYTLSPRLIPEVYAFWIARAYLHGKALPARPLELKLNFCYNYMMLIQATQRCRLMLRIPDP